MYSVSYDIRYSYPGDKPGIILPVRLTHGGESVTMEAAVDTGASYCLFARSVADALSIDVEAGLPQVFASVGGRVEAFGHEVQLAVLGMEVTATVFFFADEAIRKNVLGRRGWLDRVHCGLDEYGQLIYLSHRD